MDIDFEKDSRIVIVWWRVKLWVWGSLFLEETDKAFFSKALLDISWLDSRNERPQKPSTSTCVYSHNGLKDYLFAKSVNESPMFSFLVFVEKWVFFGRFIVCFRRLSRHSLLCCCQGRREFCLRRPDFDKLRFSSKKTFTHKLSLKIRIPWPFISLITFLSQTIF